MSKLLLSTGRFTALSDPTVQRSFVVQISTSNQEFFLLFPGTDVSQLPRGEKLFTLKSIPTTSAYTSIIDAPKQTSQAVIECLNPDNVFGPILARNQLLLNAAVRVYVVFQDLGWAQRIALLRGYVGSFILSDTLRLNVLS